jgi:hypothetical protein
MSTESIGKLRMYLQAGISLKEANTSLPLSGQLFILIIPFHLNS